MIPHDLLSFYAFFIIMVLGVFPKVLIYIFIICFLFKNEIIYLLNSKIVKNKVYFVISQYVFYVFYMTS